MAGPRFGLEGTGSTGEQYARDLKRAAGYKPITQEDLKTAYKQYDQKPGAIKGTHTDAYLYKRATDTVVTWWKNQKAEEAKKAAKAAADKAAADAAAAEAARKAAAASSGGSTGGGASGSSSGGGSSGGYTGPMLPNTSVSAKPTAVPKLAPIPQPLSATYVSQMLTRYGFSGVKPPAYALKNKAEFDAWLGRAIQYRQMTLTQSTRVAVTPTAPAHRTTGTSGARVI